MKSHKIPINDFSGGLNNRDKPAELAKNELAELENWVTDEGAIGHVRYGKDLIQYAPIDPEVFVDDASTIGLWHLDGSDPFTDSSTVSPINLTKGGASIDTGQEIGIFSNSRKFYSQTASAKGSYILTGTSAGYFGNQQYATYECWIRANATYSGRPILDVGGSGGYVSNSDVPLITTGSWSPTNGPNQGDRRNGIYIFRDWDYVNSKDAGDPYVKFYIRSNSSSSGMASIRSGAIPVGRWVHIRAIYNGDTGSMSIYINGALSASGSVTGGGSIYEPASITGSRVVVGGTQALAIDPDDGSTGALITGSAVAFDGLIDEIRISTVDRGSASFPFKKPRGKPLVLSRADGTQQAIVSADEGLYYTVGDGNWTLISNTNFSDGSTFSATDYWDGIQIGDILYMSNGIDDPVAWDGDSLKPWGNGVTAPGALAVASASGLDAGEHEYVYTYEYADGETGPSPLTAITNVANDQNIISDIPTRHDNCVNIKVYRTIAGGSDYYLLRVIPNDPNVASVSMSGPYVSDGDPETDSGMDGVSDATLIGDVDYAAMSGVVSASAIKKFKYLTGNFNRVFGSGVTDRQYDMFWSEFSPDVFKAASFVRAKADRGPIIGIARYEGEVHASKDGNATLVLRGENPNTWAQFETVHATLGCVDHWGYVLRTIPGSGGASDRTILCFPARDGFYGYAGSDFFKISEKINGSFDQLSATHATRLQYELTTQRDWEQQASLGGSVSQNIQCSQYETDGLREEPGKIKIVNQLDYIGLWSNNSPLVTGRVIGLAKGAGVDEYWFSTDGVANTIYHTTDNFKTLDATSVAVGSDGRFVIEIVYTQIGGVDNLFAFTSDTSDAGHVYRIIDPVGVYGVGPAVTQVGVDTYYWQADVEWNLNSSQASTYNNGIGNGNSTSGLIITNSNFGYNPYINHAQNIYLNRTSSAANTFTAYLNTAVLTEANLNYWFYRNSSAALIEYVSATIGFKSFQSGNVFYIRYTNREISFWRGGTFRPQAFYAANKLWWVGGGAEDSNSWRVNALFSYDLTNISTEHNAGFSHLAIAQDGTSIWMTKQAVSTSGFVSTLYKSALASISFVAQGTSLAANILPFRLSLDASSAKIVYVGKKYPNTNDSWTYQGIVLASDIVPVTYTTLNTFTANGASGAYPIEIIRDTAVTDTWFVAMNGMQSGEFASIAKITYPSSVWTYTVFNAAAYEGLEATTAITGICSPLIWVAASGSAGNYLWSDRLYWCGYSATSIDSRMIQLGTPGSWEVKGTFEAEKKNLGVFTAFDTFESDYEGQKVDYYVRYGEDSTVLTAATYLNQEINAKILGWTINTIPTTTEKGGYVQWKADLSWSYAVASPTSSPEISYVAIRYFLGNAVIPRIVGVHFGNRTYWCVAEDGQTENNLILVYQKNNTWATYRNWPVKGWTMFRNYLVGLEDYAFVHYETGQKDMGNQIRSKMVTGAIMGGRTDKMLADVKANIMSFVNKDFPDKQGWMIFTPVQAGVPVTASAWAIPVPVDSDIYQRQVQGVPNSGTFTYPWARALQFQLETSTNESGDYLPFCGQFEDIQAILIELWETEDNYYMDVR